MAIDAEFSGFLKLSNILNLTSIYAHTLNLIYVSL